MVISTPGRMWAKFIPIPIEISTAGQSPQKVALTVRVTEQERRDVEMLVTNTSGQILTGATVSLVRQAATLQVTEGVTTTFNQHFTGRTNSSGRVSLADLPLGDYTYLITRPGYKSRSDTLSVQLPVSGLAQQGEGAAFA